MKRTLKALLAVIAASAPLLGAASAEAQSSRLPKTDWRQGERTDALKKHASSQSLAFEIRFGTYYPDIDSAFPRLGSTTQIGGASFDFPRPNTPYQTVFGDSRPFYFGLELDYLPFRIPYVGVIGPGFGWGYSHNSAAAKSSYDHETVTTQETSFTVMPMHLSAVLRIDELMRRFDIPIVPYGKLGLGLGYWTTGPDFDAFDKFPSSGASWGYHAAVGGMLSLNFIDQSVALRLDENLGVNHIYVFGEWTRAGLNGLGSKPLMSVGSSSWCVGLAIDM